MVVEDPRCAQIELLLASDNRDQVQELLRDMRTSKFAYCFAALTARAALVEGIVQRLARNGGTTPTVVVIDYTFAGSDCEVLLEAAGKPSCGATIACVVTNPPPDDRLRARLTALGARLFDGEAGEAAALLTLH